MRKKELFKDLEILDKYSWRIKTYDGKIALERLKWLLVSTINELEKL